MQNLCALILNGWQTTCSCVSLALPTALDIRVYNRQIYVCKDQVKYQFELLNLAKPLFLRIKITNSLITYTYSHYKNEADLASKALVLALTRVMLNHPYSPEDLGQPVRVAI